MLQETDGYQAPSRTRWGEENQAWSVATRYQVIDVAAAREELNRRVAASGAQVQYRPVPEIERSGVLEVVYQELTHIDQEPEPWALYDPLTVNRLPDEFAALYRNGQAAVLRFAHKRGMLGYGFLKGPIKTLSEPEPLEWIWAHAETVHRILQLDQLVEFRPADPNVRTPFVHAQRCLFHYSVHNHL